MLCRVRRKSSLPGSSWEDRNVPSYEPAGGYFPIVMNDPSILYNDCPMLPYIFASQNFSCNEKASAFRFQTNDKPCTSLISDEKNLQFSITSLDHLQKSCVLPSKKITKVNIESEDTVKTISDNESMNFYGTDLSEGSHVGSVQWDSLMQHQDLHHLAFTGNE